MPGVRVARHAGAALLLLASALGSTVAWAGFDFKGTKALVAVTAEGERLSIGTVGFTPSDQGLATFRLSLRDEAFTDHFLSMKEFKCLANAREITCHVPFPYRNPAIAGPGRTAWLEHSLLFLFKSPKEFGAKLWNGVYYRFEEQGSALVGSPMAVDLNEISAPPADDTVPPFGTENRHEMPADARWIRQLVIE
ncbi:MAG: hypothetical protein R3E99_15295 [Burkholderiaceae bacterium]